MGRLSLISNLCRIDIRSLKTSAPAQVASTASTSAEQNLPITRQAMAGSNQLSLETPQNKAGTSVDTTFRVP